MRAPILELNGWKGQDYFPGKFVCNKIINDPELRVCKTNFVGQQYARIESELMISAKEKYVKNIYDIKPWSKDTGQCGRIQEGAEMHCMRCNEIVGVRLGHRIHFLRFRVAECVNKRGRSILQ